MAQSQSVPCRLFFILARSADTGVIFRRGPSKWVQTIGWDTRRDTFEQGQWFHGRVYEQRCDLSPDGRLMIYFAQKTNSRTLRDTEYGHAWTAISRPPYLTALALWPKGNTYGGGGLFETDERVWLNHDANEASPHPDHRPQGLTVMTNWNGLVPNEPALFERLTRDGWVQEQPPIEKRQDSLPAEDRPRLYAKPHTSGPFTITTTCSASDFAHPFQFTVRHERGETSLDGVECADWDRRGRLLFARTGKVFTGTVDPTGQVDATELADFNGARPDPWRSPFWARSW